jgi:hydrogenase-4 component B
MRVEPDEGNEVTYKIGKIRNGLQVLLNKSLYRQNPKDEDHVHKAAMSYAKFKENITFIGRSLSYGLILFCLGLCTVLIYLLVSAVL